MLEKILIFVVFLTPLIFFHELGHFLFARLFGVRVKVFSIGFGPKIFKFTKWDTEFAISAIPLGGYVKMFGDDILDPESVPVEERKYAFTHKSKWARFWIVFGGPLANFILAYWITFALLFSGERVPEPTLGNISEKSLLYDKGFRSGDTVKSLNGNEVLSVADISLYAEGGDVKSVEVMRLGETKKLSPEMPSKVFLEQFMKISPQQRKSIVVDTKGNTFFLSNQETYSEDSWSFEKIMTAAKSGRRDFYLIPINVKEGDKEEVAIISQIKNEKVDSLQLKEGEGFAEGLKARNLYPHDLVIGSVLLGAPAQKSGLEKGDLIVALNKRELSGFLSLRENLQAIRPTVPVTLHFYRAGEKKEVSVLPDVKYVNEKAVKTIGIYSYGKFHEVSYINSKPKGIFESLSLAVRKTYQSIVQTLASYQKLISGNFSRNNIGGPIAIAKVASDSFNISLSYFFKLMAIISINLGVINLFPIPVLDGGHIMFIFFEIINRGPLSKRKLEVAHQFGVSLLLLLIFAAIFNDISRFF